MKVTVGAPGCVQWRSFQFQKVQLLSSPAEQTLIIDLQNVFLFQFVARLSPQVAAHIFALLRKLYAKQYFSFSPLFLIISPLVCLLICINISMRISPQQGALYSYLCVCFCFLFVRIDGVMRTMNTEKLIKTLPIIQNQLDALLDFQVWTVCVCVCVCFAYVCVSACLPELWSIHFPIKM